MSSSKRSEEQVLQWAARRQERIAEAKRKREERLQRQKEIEAEQEVSRKEYEAAKQRGFAAVHVEMRPASATKKKSAPPKQLGQRRSAEPSTKTRQKQGTVTAIEEIKRKREERRKKREEEQRMREREVKQHGDPENVRFRRLIAKAREELCGPDTLQPIKFRPKKRVTVCVRKRPLNEKEQRRKWFDVISCPSKRSLVVHEPKTRVDLSKGIDNHEFMFDCVFHEKSSSREVYNATAGPLLEGLLRGGRFAIFAYGQVRFP